MTGQDADAGASDRAFALLQDLLPQHALSRLMHRLARSRRPWLRTALVRTVMNLYPQIEMREAAEPNPLAYASFNEFFTRALRADARVIEGGPLDLVSPVDGTMSRHGTVEAGLMVQAKGIHYSPAALLADESAAARYEGGAYACIYLAPYNYHRIHMPVAGRLTTTRYVPGALYSVNAATARAIPGLFARNERVVCEFDTEVGPVAMVLVGALFVGSIETVYAGEINPPAARGGRVSTLAEGIGRDFGRGSEIARFNMGSTVVLLAGRRGLAFDPRHAPGAPVRLGQKLLSPA